MEQNSTSKKFLQSYLFVEYVDGEPEKFFISTCYRMSSVMIDPPPWYYETFAWKLDKDNHRGKRIIADNSGGGTKDGAFEQHFEVCRQLELKGEFKGE